MSIRSRNVVSMLAITVVIGCRGSDAPTVQSVAGCWAFTRLHSSPSPLDSEFPDTVQFGVSDFRRPDESIYPGYPLRLAVLSHRIGAWRDSLDHGRANPPLEPPDWDRYFIVGWRRQSADSIQAAVASNTESWEFHLRTFGARPDSLEGIVVYFNDGLPNGAPAISIIGARTKCGDRSPHAS